MEPSNTIKNQDRKKPKYNTKANKKNLTTNSHTPPPPKINISVLHHLILCKTPQAQNSQVCIEYETSTHRKIKSKRE